MQRLLTGVAYALGAVPTQARWAHRLQHLHGEFRRTSADWWSVVFTAAVLAALGGAFVGLCIRTVLQKDSPFFSAWFAVLAAVVFGLAVWFLRRLDIRYEFENGELRAVRGGVVLWREDLTGLERVTATQGRTGVIWMTLTWPDRTRRMELYRSVQAELEKRSDELIHSSGKSEN